MTHKLFPIAALALIVACSVPIAGDLEERDANQAVVALERSGVVGHKEVDPEYEGRWRVTVARDDASSAVAVLTRESLPPSKSPGVLDALDKGSIVPSRLAEHAKLIAGTAGELERSLRAIDGVLSARVHLAVPPKDSLYNGDQAPRPTASVLLRHRGARAPITAPDVQRLVAGAVPGLSAEHVSVVATATATAVRSAERELVRFGPISLTRSSLPAFRLMIGVVSLLNVALIGVLVALWMKARKVRPASELGS